jgi:hypothetical protein
MNTLKTLSKQKHEVRSDNDRGTELTPKLRTDMVSFPRKLFVEALPHRFLTQNTKEEFWQPRGTPEEGRRRMK